MKYMALLSICLLYAIPTHATKKKRRLTKKELHSEQRELIRQYNQLTSEIQKIKQIIQANPADKKDDRPNIGTVLLEYFEGRTHEVSGELKLLESSQSSKKECSSTSMDTE